MTKNGEVSKCGLCCGEFDLSINDDCIVSICPLSRASVCLCVHFCAQFNTTVFVPISLRIICSFNATILSR